jgi:hypothetical protein
MLSYFSDVIKANVISVEVTLTNSTIGNPYVSGIHDNHNGKSVK